MIKPTFFRGVLLALVLSIVAATLFPVLTTVLSVGFVLKVIFSLVTVTYIGFLLRHTRERTGRWVTLTIWLLITATTGYVSPSLAVFVAVQVGLIWLIRSLYYYSSSLSAIADLVLSGLGFSAAIWATSQTHSLFLAVWVFFLTQSLFVLISTNRKPKSTGVQSEATSRFGNAHRTAESALRKLTTQQS